MKVEITHDIACAWSALGYARFQRAAGEHRADGGELTVVFKPYKTTAPPARTPSNRAHPHLAPATHADRIVRAAAADGLVMNLDRIVPADTVHAHRLIATAAALGAAEDMTTRLYRAYFTDGLDIADADVLRNLASQTGVPWTGPKDGEQHPADHARSTRASAPRVPVFRFPDGTVLVGAVTLTALRTELRQASARAVA